MELRNQREPQLQAPAPAAKPTAKDERGGTEEDFGGHEEKARRAKGGRRFKKVSRAPSHSDSHGPSVMALNSIDSRLVLKRLRSFFRAPSRSRKKPLDYRRALKLNNAGENSPASPSVETGERARAV